MSSNEPALSPHSTAREAAERTLAARLGEPGRTTDSSAALLADLVQRFGGSLEQVFWMRTLRFDRVVYVSAAFEQIWGHPCQAVGANPHTWLDAIHRDDRPRAHAAMRSGAAYEIEYRIVREDARERWVRERGFPVQNARGVVDRVAGIAEDITTRKHAEHEREKLLRLIEHSRDFIAMADTSGRVTYLNAGGRRMIGWPEDKDLGGLHFADYVPATWQTFFRNTVLRSVRRNGSWEGEMQLRNLQTGALIDVSRSTFLVRDPNTRALVGYATVTRDITLAKKLQRELLDSSERERRQVGHELHDGLGQHLHAVYYLSTLLDHALREERSPHAAEAARLSKLLKQAAALTRGLARGLQPVSAVPEGLMVALRELAKQTRALYDIDCRLACRQPVHLASNATSTHLFRIAQEAVNNAVRHGSPRRIDIALNGSAGRIVLRVTDDGVGIQPGRRRTSGMGLHVMQHRADAMSGTLVVQPLPHGGTELVCSIPLPARADSDSPFTPINK